MNKLKDLADQSVEGIKHEIYAKDSTGGHATAGESAASRSDVNVTVQFDPNYIKEPWTCPACGVTMPAEQKKKQTI